MHPPYVARHLIMSEVVECVGRNWSLDRVAARDGMPSRQTLHRWMKATPVFAQQVADARRRARFEARQARRAQHGFCAAQAEAFLERVRSGETVRDLVRRPEGPNRDRLNQWKVERPDFAAALAAAVASVRRPRPARAYDEVVADAFLVRLARGGPTRGGKPGRTLVRQWQAADEEFAGSYEAAKRIGHRRRMRALSKCTPALVDKIVARIELGDSLHSLSRRRGMPHYVTLYGWMRTRPEFAAAVAKACDARESILNEQKLMRLDGVPETRVRALMRQIGAVTRRARPRRPGRTGQ